MSAHTKEEKKALFAHKYEKGEARDKREMENCIEFPLYSIFFFGWMLSSR